MRFLQEKTAFLFSGQGAQYPGMAKELYENSPAARRVFQTADRVLERSISELCFYGNQEELNQTHNTQPCMLAADLAAYGALKEAGIKPDMVAGFSLGEYAALVASGVLSVEDAFSLIQKRADFMQEAVPEGQGAMAAVGKMDREEVEDLCSRIDGYLALANYNCPGQIVVSGEKKAVEALCSYGEEHKLKILELPVSGPFHCHLMESAAQRLRKSMGEISLSVPECELYMNVSAEPAAETEKIRENLLLQVTSPVLWQSTLEQMYEDGAVRFIECGPGKTLSGFVKKTLKGKEIEIISVSDWKTLQLAEKGMGKR